MHMNDDIIKELYSKFLKNPFVTTDSRSIDGKTIFFALKGENFDGNSFAEKALENGAVYAVIDNPVYCRDDRYILVEDSLKALQELAKHHRENMPARVLGITGTNGKTTTKELVNAVLSSTYETVSTTGNLNNHIGVPLTLLKIRPSTEYAIIEMGANHKGEIAELCSIAKPDFGIITNIGKAHLEGFGSFENIILTKKELYNAVRDNKGMIFINRDNHILSSISDAIDSFTYGLVEKVQCRGEIITCDPFLFMAYKYGEDADEVKTQLIGHYNAENVLAAISVGLYFGINPLLIREAVESYTPSNNRSQKLQTGKNTLILDAYNANPTSLALAIENFANMPGSTKVLMIGDMAELGSLEKQEHREIIRLIRKHDFQRVFLAGPLFHSVNDTNEFTSFENTGEFAEYLKKHPLSGSMILIKGSRRNKLETLIQYL